MYTHTHAHTHESCYAPERNLIGREEDQVWLPCLPIRFSKHTPTYTHTHIHIPLTNQILQTHTHLHTHTHSYPNLCCDVAIVIKVFKTLCASCKDCIAISCYSGHLRFLHAFCGLRYKAFNSHNFVGRN